MLKQKQIDHNFEDVKPGDMITLFNYSQNYIQRTLTGKILKNPEFYKEEGKQILYTEAQILDDQSTVLIFWSIYRWILI